MTKSTMDDGGGQESPAPTRSALIRDNVSSPISPPNNSRQEINPDGLMAENAKLQATLEALKVKAKDRIVALQTQVHSLTTQVNEMKKHQPAPVNTVDSQAMRDLEASKSKISETLAARENQITRIMNQMMEKDDTIQQLEEKVSSMITSNMGTSDGTQKVIELESKIRESVDQVAQFHHQHVEDVEAKNKVISEQARMIEAMSSQMNKSSGNIEELAELQSKIASYESQIEDTKNTLETANTQVDRLQHSLEEESKLKVEALEKLNAAAALEQQCAEYKDLIQGYGRQIKELHKTTAVIHARETEVQKKNAELENMNEQNESDQRKLQERDYTIKQNQARIIELEEQLTNDSVAKEIAESNAAALAKVKEKLEVETAIVNHELKCLQSEKDNADIASKTLQDELSSVKIKLSTLESTNTEYSQQLEELARAKANVEQLILKVESTSASFESAQREIKELNEKVHSQQLQIDGSNDSQAGVVAQYETQLAHLKSDLQKSVREARDSSAHLESLRQSSSSSTGALTEQLNSSKQAALDFKEQHAKVQVEFETVSSQSNKTINEQKDSLAQANGKVAALAAQLSALSAVKSDSGQISTNNSEQWKVEWTEKYRVVEKENIRLRERSLRTEQLLNQLQQQSSNTLTQRSSTGAMHGVKVLPWLDGKFEDEDDGGESGALPSAIHSTPRLRGASTLIPFMRVKVRQGLRYVDKRAVEAALWLKEKPASRLGWMFYAFVLHVIILSLLLSGGGGSNQQAPNQSTPKPIVTQ